jgi:hypothetical protein
VAQDPAGCGGFPRLHKRAVSLAESKLVSVAVEGPRVTVILDALVQVSQGRPGVDGGTSWEQPVALVFQAAQVEEAPARASLPLWLEGGALAEGSGTEAALVAVPGALAGEVRLQLWAAAGRLTVRGSGLSIEEKGNARFVERFAGR